MEHADAALVVSLLVGLVVGLVAFLGRNAFADIKAHSEQLAELDTARADLRTHGESLALLDKALAVSRAERVGERVSKLETDMAEIKGDLREARGDLRRVREWVDQQTAPGPQHRHRRSTDPKDQE